MEKEGISRECTVVVRQKKELAFGVEVIYFIYMEMGERENSRLSTRQRRSCHVHVDLLGELNYCKGRETGRVSPEGACTCIEAKQTGRGRESDRLLGAWES